MLVYFMRPPDLEALGVMRPLRPQSPWEIVPPAILSAAQWVTTA